MEKICGIIVFLSVYQLAGMLDFHDLPIMKSYHLSGTCHAVLKLFGMGGYC